MSQQQTTSRVIDGDWWAKKGDELASTLGMVFRMVRDENQWMTAKDNYHWGLYEGTGDGRLEGSSTKNLTWQAATLPDNVCKMGPDTLTAKVATIRPIPQVLTTKGNWKDRRRARKLRQLIQGEFYRQQVHEKLSARIIKDALVARGGFVQVFVDGKKPKIERVLGHTLFTDQWDAEFGEPLSLYRLRTLDRRKAVATWGTTEELKDKIRNAGYLSSTIRTSIRDESRSSTAERIELLEAWYRCPDHDPDDETHECAGRHVIMCDGTVLFDEPWPHAFFPFAMLTYDTPNKGFFGTGMVQTLEGYQSCIDDANWKHDDALMNSTKLVILQDGGGVFKSDITDGIRVAHCRPGPYAPTVVDIDLVNEHVANRAPTLVQRALEAVGVSQMSAQAKHPQGIEAAVALQTLDDIESQRHIVFGRRFESWCMDVARLLIECVKKIAREFGDYAVKVPMKDGAYLPLNWKDVEIDGFQLEMQSVGQLYTSFAGRLEKLKTLFEMGAIDKGQFMAQLDAGDVQSELDLETVDRLVVDEMIEAMLDTEQKLHANDNTDYLAPNEFLPLAWAHRRAHQKRLQAQMNGAPQHVLDLLGRFIDDIQHLEDRAKAEAMSPAGGPVQVDVNAPVPPPDPGMPMPPPGGGMLPMPPEMPMGMAPSGDQLLSGPGGAMPGMPPPPMMPGVAA